MFFCGWGSCGREYGRVLEKGFEVREIAVSLLVLYFLDGLERNSYFPDYSDCRNPDGGLRRSAPVQKSFTEEGSESPFGAFVTMGGTEYELGKISKFPTCIPEVSRLDESLISLNWTGWLVFDQVPPKSEGEEVGWELVAMIYDGAYDGLGGDRFVVEGV